MKIHEPIEAQYLYELAKERNNRIEILDTLDVDKVVALAEQYPELKAELFKQMQIKLKTQIAEKAENLKRVEKQEGGHCPWYGNTCYP